ncbi:MAG: hypothetical protein CVU05_01960 [Bacteroidetes bacterium HGW-Bacteroidetes-21]|jgi:hypothetical protein|nr:MAG: hypothetical protein CVU05_01960 [Bacteroidetes bacterium HGW-Bacteroidetes-21]
MKLIIVISILVAFVCSCLRNQNEDYNKKPINLLYEKRLIEAKWRYYEYNFNSKGISCNQTCFYDTSICFVDGMRVDTMSIGDTFEIELYTSIKDSDICVTYGNNIFYNIFGYYPNSDTITYIWSDSWVPNRKVQNALSTNTNEQYGVYPWYVREKMFKEFIIKNEPKLNKFIKEEAKKRGYIN